MLITITITKKDNNLKLFAKSELIKQFFDNFQTYRLNEYPLLYDGKTYWIQLNRKENILFYEGYRLVNLSFLTAEGLNEGIEIDIMEPYTDTEIKLFLTIAKEFVVKLYNEYIAPKTFILEVEDNLDFRITSD
ncbi:MAG: hypothetical protein QW474_01590 [Candidatus Aenigmatarchaeota archaeon]